MLTRRTLLTAALGTSGLVVAGCAANPPGATPTAPADTGTGFPVTVQHKFGTTTVPAAPQRVVSVGVTEQDAISPY